MNNYSRQQSEAPVNPPQVESADKPVEHAQWYYLVGDKTCGPTTTDELKNLISSGALPDNAYVFCEGMKDWSSANSVSEFRLIPPPLPNAGISQNQPPSKISEVLENSRRKRLLVAFAISVLVVAGAGLGFRQIWSAKLHSNTVSSWARYKEIKDQNYAYYDLDKAIARKKRRSALWEVYSQTMDKDLKNLIGARIVLLDKRSELVDQAEAKFDALKNKATVRGVLGGMVGGLLSPDDPIAGGAVVGGIAASTLDDEASRLLESVKAADEALKIETEKLDAYEADVLKTLADRYKW